jgi:hypothetical protein
VVDLPALTIREAPNIAKTTDNPAFAQRNAYLLICCTSLTALDNQYEGEGGPRNSMVGTKHQGERGMLCNLCSSQKSLTGGQIHAPDQEKLHFRLLISALSVMPVLVHWVCKSSTKGTLSGNNPLGKFADSQFVLLSHSLQQLLQTVSSFYSPINFLSLRGILLAKCLGPTRMNLCALERRCSR